MTWFVSSNPDIQPWVELNGTVPVLGLDQIDNATNASKSWVGINCTQVCNYQNALMSDLAAMGAYTYAGGPPAIMESRSSFCQSN